MSLRISTLLTGAAVVALALLACPARAEDLPAPLASPDGRLELTVRLDPAGRPQWQLALAGKPLLQPGALGIELTREPLRPPFVLAQIERSTADSTWHPVWGNRSTVRDRYNQLLVTLRESAAPARTFQVALRAYDEGVGIRYTVPAQPGLDRVAIKRTLTEFAFDGDRPIYQNRNYEYGTVTIAQMSRSEGAVTVDAGDRRFVGLTDADRADFSATAFERSKQRPNTIVSGLRSPAEGAAPFHTSWEAVIVGDTAARLCENRHLVENLCPPCVIADPSWIRPGPAICQVRNTRLVTSELKRLMDFASAHRLAHVEIDHSWCGAETKWTAEEVAFFDKNHSKFWADKPEWRSNVGGNPMAPAEGWVPFRPKADSGGNFVDLDVADLAAYGAKLNPPVGVCLYLRASVVKEFGGEHPADDIFAVYNKWGVAGIKLGFVPNGSQQWERAIADVVRKAAGHELIVNIHDGYFPAGLSRTYPNLVNVEGVAGEESEHSIPAALKSRHDLMLPFTRCLMGPVDYTPEMFKPAVKTNAHQVAMLGVFHGRPSIRGGMRQWSPGGSGGTEVEYVDELPALYDDLRVFADLGKWVTVARRKGDAWFVTSLCDGRPRDVNLKLDFLAPGRPYAATVWSDTPGQPDTTRATLDAATADTTVPIRMQANGGHIMILRPRAAR